MEYKKIVRAILSNKKKSIGQQIAAIKQSVNPGDYKEALKMHPVFFKYLFQKPFFKNVEEIRLKESFFFTGDLKKEFRWATLFLENYFTEINLFIELKLEFESHFIVGDFNSAKDDLQEIEKMFGVSLWSIEAHLLLEEYINGSEANWNILSEYLNKINNPFYEFITNSNSKRIEKKLSYEACLNQFQNDLDNVNATLIVQDFLVFKNFHVANYPYAYKSLESVLHISNIFSLIDQYLLVIDVILYNIGSSNNNDKIFQQFISKACVAIGNDIRLKKIDTIINKSCIQTTENELSNSIYDCLDNFYYGRYEDALEQAKIGIKNQPLEFEYYELYSKSLINLRKNFEPIAGSNLQNDLLSSLFEIFKFKNNSDASYKRLLKILLIFVNSNFGKQIHSCIAELEGVYNKFFAMGAISSSFYSPKMLQIPERINFVTENLAPFLRKHSFKIAQYKLGIEAHFPNGISESKSQEIILSAIHNFSVKNFEKSIEILESSEEVDSINYYYERKISLQYKSYLNLQEYRKALLLFGMIQFEDTVATRKITQHELYESIKAANSINSCFDLIELPILFSLVVKEYDLFEVYDEFMLTYDIHNIKEINVEEFIEKFTLKKVVYFLSNVCTIETIKYSTDYNSISEVEEDRISILEKLIEIDSINKLKYEQEIGEIYRVNSVRKVLKEVDEGRLYIDVNSLKEIQIRNFKDDFNRFKEIEILANNQSIIGFNASSVRNWEKEIEINENIERFNTADYLAFKNIYLESRDNFLFSKEYGLDSCLSTRIRHGALKNHIRSIFEKLDLLTSKTNDIYSDNYIWLQQLGAYTELNDEVQACLKRFSRQIDDYNVFIVENLIQIQTEKTSGKEDGLFTFFTNDDVLFKFYTTNKIEFESAESTIDKLLMSLVNHTLLDVQKKIVAAFSDTIPKKFQYIIDSLVTELRELNLPTDCQLIPNLIKSSTEIQKELENISDWFYLNTTSSTTLLSIETVIDASIELTNKINPNTKIEIEKNYKCEPFGVYSSLIFAFNILFNNIIQHSHLPSDEVKIKITSDVLEERYVLITISNTINPNYDYSENIEKLSTIKHNWNDHSNIERSNKEGESGFDKIKRILLYEVYSKTDKFDFSIEDNCISITLFFPYNKIINE